MVKYGVTVNFANLPKGILVRTKFGVFQNGEARTLELTEEQATLLDSSKGFTIRVQEAPNQEVVEGGDE